MKNRLILIGLIFLLISCNLAQRDDGVSEDITDKSEIGKEISFRTFILRQTINSLCIHSFKLLYK